ncbi:Uncharacterized mitochondrial protein AtMg00310 [Linum perenne]
MNWLKWEKLCVSKDDGGMGFRNLHGFNMALLAKAKYYPRGDFLSAERGANPSVVWQSIWQAKPITPMIEGLEGLRVHDLFIPGLPQCDFGLIEELFDPRDVDAILKILIRRLEGQDQVIWHFGKSGGYSVSSSYRWWLEHASNIRTHR